MSVNKRHTLKSIALDMGVSIATVSFVLNGKAEEKRISEKQTKKIKEYCDEIGYRPNLLAQTLRTGKSKIIVVIVENIYSKLARIIEEIAHGNGYHLIFCSNNNRDDKTIKFINLFRDRNIAGFVLAPSPNVQNEVQKLIDDEFPLVLIDRYFKDINSNFVVTENFSTSQTVTKKLIDNGFKKILFITPQSNQTQLVGRLEGYKTVVKENNLKEYILQLPFEDKTLRNRENKLKEALATLEYDAIFFATGYLARLGIEILKDNFSDLLDKIGIYTYDDEVLFKLFKPSISAVYQPLKEMGEEIMKIILEEMNNPSVENNTIKKQVVLKCEFRDRESSQRKDMHLKAL